MGWWRQSGALAMVGAFSLSAFSGLAAHPESPDCAPAPQDAQVSHPVTDAIVGELAEQSLVYQHTGTFDVQGPNQGVGTFEGGSSRMVRNVVSNVDATTYDVQSQLGGVTSLHSMRADAAGLFLERIVTRLPDDQQFTFAPATALRILGLPLGADGDLQVGADPGTFTAMAFTVENGGIVNVDICGTLVEAVRVALTGGRFDGPNADVEFEAQYDIATQFGGLVLADHTVLFGREQLDTVHRDNLAVLTEVPRLQPSKSP
ncbi:MAG: hypothetical protein ACI867_000595 [Glaciecola sp.]